MKDKEDREKEIQKYLNTVHCMDCIEFMKWLPDQSVDLILTDPPYGIGNDGGSYRDRKWWGHRTLEKLHRDKDIPEQQYFEEMLRVWKNLVIRWGNYFTDYLPASRCWLYRDKMMWGDFSDWELAWTSFDSVLKSYRYCNKESWKEHPTQKPISLFRRILENYSEPWMTILDCFAWSWTTWVACKELWRNYILVEKEQKYVDIIQKRLEGTTISLFH